MNLNRLEINNFGSFGENNIVDFSTYPDNDRILVIGENRDSAGSDSNGSGKSTLFNAISWAIFGKLPNGVDVEDVIRRGSSEASVKLLLKNAESELTIIRVRTRNKQRLSFFVNGKDKTRRTTQQTQIYLLQYFGILENNKNYFSDFLNTTYFSVAAIKSFAGKDSTPKDRLDLIARFLNLELLDKCTNRSKVYAQKIKTKLTQHQGQIQYLQDKIENGPDLLQLKQDITDLKELINVKEVENGQLNIDLKQAEEKNNITIELQDLRSQISRFESDSKDYIDLLKGQKSDYEEKLSKREELNSQYHSDMAKLGEYDLKELEGKRDKIKEHLEKGKNKLLRVKEDCGQKEKKIFFYQSQLDHSKNCPGCGTELMIVQNNIKQLDTIELNREIEAYHKQLEISTKEYQDLKNAIKTFEKKVEISEKEVWTYVHLSHDIDILHNKLEELKNIPELIKEIDIKIKDKLKSDKKYLKILINKQTSLEFRLLKYKEVDETLIEGYKEKIKANNNLINDYKDATSRATVIIQQNKEESKKFDKLKEQEKEFYRELESFQFWIEGFPQIRTWMIESFLPSFEEQVNTYLNNMEVGMRVIFQTYKETKVKNKDSDKYRYKFDIKIIDENNNKRNIETYSAGETKRIGVAVGFALRELTLTRGYNSFDFLLLDEVVDSLDETGILEFFELLNIISGLKFVISHNSSLKTRFSKIIKVIKEDGKSTVAQII